MNIEDLYPLIDLCKSGDTEALSKTPEILTQFLQLKRQEIYELEYLLGSAWCDRSYRVVYNAVYDLITEVLEAEAAKYG